MSDRMLCKKRVCILLDIARATLDRRRKTANFPKARKPEGKSTGPCYWLESEINAYMKDMPCTNTT